MQTETILTPPLLLITPRSTSDAEGFEWIEFPAKVSNYSAHSIPNFYLIASIKSLTVPFDGKSKRLYISFDVVAPFGALAQTS